MTHTWLGCQEVLRKISHYGIV